MTGRRDLAYIAAFLLARACLRKAGGKLTPAPGDKTGAVYQIEWEN